MKIALLIRSLDSGGAQTQLSLLARTLAARGHTVQVLTFYPGGIVGEELTRHGIPPLCLNKNGRWDVFGFAWRLVKALRAQRADAVYSFLTTSNILTGLLGPLIGPIKVVWGIRATNLALGYYTVLDRVSERLEAWLSCQADVIICNAKQGLEDAAGRGMPRAKLTCIPNAIDTQRFAPDERKRTAARVAWGIDGHECVIGMAARVDPMKGHDIFLNAFRRLRARHPHVRAVLVGRGTQELDEPGVLALGERADMENIYPGWDIACLSSRFGEGFSNAIAEAMASAIPAVSTTVGDSADIIKDTGWCAPSNNEDALLKALTEAVSQSAEVRAQQGANARALIQERYSPARLAERTEEALLTGS